MAAKIEISEQDGLPPVYHWRIVSEDNGREVAHSAYHTDREKCDIEGSEALREYESGTGRFDPKG